GHELLGPEIGHGPQDGLALLGVEPVGAGGEAAELPIFARPLLNGFVGARQGVVDGVTFLLVVLFLGDRDALGLELLDFFAGFFPFLGDALEREQAALLVIVGGAAQGRD